MKFLIWLKKQKNRDDPTGDLAKDYISEGCKNEFSYKYLKNHPHACEEAKQSYVDSYNEWAVKHNPSLLKRKYYAYLHKNKHWSIKCWANKKRFMEIIEDGFHKDSFVQGVIMPFEIYEKLEAWSILSIEEGNFCLSDIESKLITKSPQLIHIKNMIDNINWNIQ